MNHMPSLFPAMLLLPALVFAQDNVVRKPLAIGTKIETGQVVKGVDNETGGDPDRAYISRLAVSLTQETVIDERFEVKAGVGGVFFNIFPDVRGNEASQGIKFGPGITQAQAAYKLGSDIQKPTGILRAGFFPYKYNPDAKNLGEYLFRTMPYPSIIMTGGWALTDNAFVRMQGLQATFFGLDNRLKADVFLTSERDFRPAGNFTPSALVQYTQGAFEVGAGISLFHFLPLDKERLLNKEMGGGLLTVYQYEDVPAFTVDVDPNGDTISGGYTHSGGTVYMNGSDRQYIELQNTGVNWDSLDAFRDTIEYDTRGIKLMARASFSIQKLVPMSMLNPQDLKVYVEAALLGWKNQPGLFNKRSERIPVMLGVNLPTFRLLDFLSFEVEYFPSPLPDDWKNVRIHNYPAFDDHSVLLRGVGNYAYDSDDWKWSLYASRTIATGLSIRGQIANDHFRSIDQAGTNFSGRPSLRNLSDWYYIVTLNFGI